MTDYHPRLNMSANGEKEEHHELYVNDDEPIICQDGLVKFLGSVILAFCYCIAKNVISLIAAALILWWGITHKKELGIFVLVPGGISFFLVFPLLYLAVILSWMVPKFFLVGHLSKVDIDALIEGIVLSKLANVFGVLLGVLIVAITAFFFFFG